MDPTSTHATLPTGPGPVLPELTLLPAPPNHAYPNWGKYLSPPPPSTSPPTPPPAADWDSPVWVYGMPELQVKGRTIDVGYANGSSAGSVKYLGNLWELVQLLAQCLQDGAGAGLAAQQVGNPYRVFIFNSNIAYVQYMSNDSVTYDILDAPPSTWQTDFPLTTNSPTIGAGVPYEVIINPSISPDVDTMTPPIDSNLFWQPSGNIAESCMSFPGLENGNANIPDSSNPSKLCPTVSFTTNRLKTFTISYYTFKYTLDSNNNPVPQSLVSNSYSFTSPVYSGTPPSNATANSILNWVLQHETDHTNGILFTERMASGDVANNQCALNSVQAGLTTASTATFITPGYQIQEGHTAPA